ncbi:hypothetical protein SNEBB_007734 [Seison nebaliae]|nr:hypothetical protein SNEBB_007734 [Seison nebaliae]
MRSLLPHNMNYDDTWERLRLMMDHLLRPSESNYDKNTAKREWRQRFDDIYHLANAYPGPYCESMYKDIRGHLRRHVMRVMKEFVLFSNSHPDYSTNDDDEEIFVKEMAEKKLEKYLSEWSTYQTGCNQIDRMFQYLNEHWINMLLTNNRFYVYEFEADKGKKVDSILFPTDNFSHVGVSEENISLQPGTECLNLQEEDDRSTKHYPLLTINEMSSDIWLKGLQTFFHNKSINHIIGESMSNIYNEMRQKHEEMPRRSFKISLHLLDTLNQLKCNHTRRQAAYDNMFHNEFISATISTLRLKVEQLYNKVGIREYLNELNEIYEWEVNTCQNCIPLSSSILIEELKNIMIETHPEWLTDKIDDILSPSDSVSLKYFHFFLNHDGKKLFFDKLANFVLNEIQTSLDEMDKSIDNGQSDVDPRKTMIINSKIFIPQLYIEKLNEIHLKYVHIIKNIYLGSGDATAAIDRAFQSIINRTKLPVVKGETLLEPSELVCKYVDFILRKKNLQDYSDEELDEFVNNAIQIFIYLDSKDIFQQLHIRLMSKRFLSYQSQSMSVEQQFVMKLKNLCGYEYTNKMLILLKDVELNKNLNKEFNNTNESLINFTPFIMQSCAWPYQENVDLKSTHLPIQMRELLDKFKEFYGNKSRGRVLTFCHDLSMVTVNYGVENRTYFIHCQLIQSLILFYFNDHTTATLNELVEFTKISEKELEKNISPLIQMKLLFRESDGEIIDGNITTENEDLIKLNEEFQSNKISLQIHPVSPKREQGVTVLEKKEINTSTKTYVQAAIVRYLKRTKEALIEEIFEFIKAERYCTVDLPFIKQSLKTLEEKGYLKFDDEQNNCIYLS